MPGLPVELGHTVTETPGGGNLLVAARDGTAERDAGVDADGVFSSALSRDRRVPATADHGSAAC